MGCKRILLSDDYYPAVTQPNVDVITDRIVGHFGGLQKLLAATTEDLQQVEGVGEARARSVRDGVSRLAEASILDRFV